MQGDTTISNGTILAIVLIGGPMALVYCVQVATLSDLSGSDAAGNAMARGFAAIETVVLWVLLAIFTAVAAARGGMPWGVGLPALVLIPLSGIAALAAGSLLASRGMAPHLWPIAIPAAVPVLVAALGLWALIPPLRALVPATLMGSVTWVLVLALSASIFPLREIREREEVKLEAVRAAWDAEFTKIGPATPLAERVRLLVTPNYVKRDELLEGIRRLATRQAEAEALLDRGDFPLGYLGQMELDPTPSLCTKAKAALRRRVEGLTLAQPQSRPYGEIAEKVADAVAAMEWLVGYGCSCDAESKAWETAAQTYRDTNYDVYRLAQLREPAELGRRLREDPERFSLLTSESRLEAWLKFADDPVVGAQALAGARRLDHREADAVRMLEGDSAFFLLRYLPELDLEASPELCSAAIAQLRAHWATIFRPRPDDPRSYQELESRLGRGGGFESLIWLAGHGCAAGPAFDEAEALIRAYRDSPDRAAMLARLAAARP